VIRSIAVADGEIVASVTRGAGLAPETSDGVSVEDGVYLHREDVAEKLRQAADGNQRLLDLAFLIGSSG
jgi:hypothetical protein